MAVNAPLFLAKDGDDRAIALTMAMNLALEQFYEERDFFDEGNHGKVYRYQNVGAGRSFQWERFTDTPSALEHVGGQDMEGQNYAVDKDTVSVDNPIVAHHWVQYEQNQMAHFDTLSRIARSTGRKVRELVDSRIAVSGIKAARTAALTKDGLSVHKGGNIVSRANASGVTGAYPATVTGARQFRDDVAQLAQLMDEDSVPQMGRYLYITPYLHRVLMQDTTILNRDLSSIPGDVNQRTLGMIEGFMLIVTNRLPDSQSITLTSPDKIAQGNSKYVLDNRFDGDVGQCTALAFCTSPEKAPVIVVEQGGFIFEAERWPTRNAEFVKSQILLGMDVLDPECAGEIRVTAS